IKELGSCLVIGLFIVTCTQSRKDTKKEEAFTPEKIEQVVGIPAFQGVYEGVLPPVEGSAVDVLLTIRQDNTFHERLEYIDRNNDIENREGHYAIEQDVLALYPEKGDTEYYKVEDNRLRKLDKDAKPIAGLLEDRYVLTKKQK
ncbi:MAG: copper resistance protein NlpE, partial [Tannerellaceae bacterium]|nr:copper resistance protein NlpE [Tannerellaceae bacterium]